MSEVKWVDSDTEGRVSFSDETPKTSEALHSDLPASERLKSHVRIKAASLSGTPGKPLGKGQVLTDISGEQDQAVSFDSDGAASGAWTQPHPASTVHDDANPYLFDRAESVNGTHSGNAAKKSFARPSVHAASRNVKITSDVRSPQGPEQPSPVSFDPVSLSSSAPGATGDTPGAAAVSSPVHAPSLTEKTSRLTYGISRHLRHQGAVRKGYSRIGSVNERFSKATRDDNIAQGAATAVRGTVQAATAASDARRFGAWSWQKSLSIAQGAIRGTLNLIHLVRTQGVFGAIGTIFRKGARRLLRSGAAAVGTLLLSLLLLFIVLFLAVSVLSSIFGVGTDMSFGSSSGSTVDELYAYCTELDADFTAQIHELLQSSGYDEVRLNCNGGQIVATDDFTINTNINQLLIYLQAANAGGIHTTEDLKAQIDEIYSVMYGWSTSSTTETVTETTTAHAGDSLGVVVTSAYCPCEICCGRWAGGPTASGVMPQAEHTLAVDAYNPIVPIGTAIIMGGILYKVEDTGNLNHYGVNFDVYHDTHFAALAWGHRSMEAFIAGNEGTEVEVTISHTISILNVNVTTSSLYQWISEHTDDTMQEQIDLINELGVYAGYASGGNPLGDGQHWAVSERFGAYADGTSVKNRNHITVRTSSGREIYSPLSGTLSWSGSTATITNTSGSGETQQITITGLSSYAPSGDVNAGVLIGTASSNSITISYQINDSYVNPVIYLANELGAGDGQAIVDIALTQLGQRGGEPYWRWFGRNTREAWCSEFVSWCANEAGFIDAGVIPKYSWSGAAIQWFQSNGQWQPGGYAPQPGDIIFYDWDGDGSSDHTGIVEDCDGTTVYTVEGNVGDVVKKQQHNINDHRIMGYGTPDY